MKRYLFSGAGLVALAVIFLAFNLASQGLFGGIRIDLTENRQYTLSDGTKRIIASIDEPIHLYFYYSREVGQTQPSIRIYAQQVRDLLKEYVLRSDGRLVLHVVDPEPFSEEEDRAAERGIQPVQLGADKLYFGLAASNAIGGKQVIPFFQPQRAASLEYDLSKALHALQHPEKPVIGVLSSLKVSGHWDPMSGPVAPWQVYRDASQLFTVKDLAAPLERIDDDVKLLWVIHPKGFDAKTRYAIDQFLMRGGQLMVFVDPFAESEPPPPGQHPIMARTLPHFSELKELFAAWGVSYDHEQVLLDRGHALTVRNPDDGRPLSHPSILGLGKAAIGTESLVTAELNRVILGYPGVLSWDPRPDVTAIPLLQSSAEGRLIPAAKAQAAYSATELTLPAAEGEGKVHTIALQLRGLLPSAFPDGPPEGVTNPDHLAKAQKPVTVLVAADVDLLADDYWLQKQQYLQQTILRPFADNGDLVVNALDKLAGSEDLIGIRSRSVYARPFERVQALRTDAEQRFRAKEQELQAKLKETEQKLADLKTGEDGQTVVLTEEQQQALAQFQAEKLRIRKELREVRHQLDKDIETLGLWLKAANIGVIPFGVAVFGTGLAAVRFRRRKKAREAHRD